MLQREVLVGFPVDTPPRTEVNADLCPSKSANIGIVSGPIPRMCTICCCIWLMKMVSKIVSLLLEQERSNMNLASCAR